MNKIVTHIYKNNKKGYTLMELLFVMAIIFILAGTSMANYNHFGKEIDLENMTYSVALTIRTAQSFGINRRDDLETGFDEPKPYGVFFTTSLIDPPFTNPTETFMVFLDNKNVALPGSNNIFDDTGTGGSCVANSSDECIEIFTMSKNVYISSICAGDNALNCTARDELHITFKRPNPDAIIKSDTLTDHAYAEIVLSSPVALGFEQVISIGVAGQISITKRAI